MDELRGPNIQVVLHVKEGLGFGFLRAPFMVCGSLNGYMLETDPVIPSHAPFFDAELVWEADKRRFRSLRVQNVPVKVEVFTMATQGRKDKIGYLLLSLLGAQPCPSNKIVDVKYSWHRLLGVKSEGKCCHPQLMMSLTIEDRINTPTPRNELRMFHSNEAAYPSSNIAPKTPPNKSMLMTLNEYLAESKKTVSTPELQPKLICDEGLIQIGKGKELFVLSFVIGAMENIDLLLSEEESKEVNCYISYSVFTHSITTDRVAAMSGTSGSRVQFNQRTSLRLATDLAALGRYFTECPHLVTKIYANEKDIGICSMDLRKLIPTEDTQHFVDKFCNMDGVLLIHERCFILRCDGVINADHNRRPYVDVEMSLKYVGLKTDVQKPKNLTARSVSHLESVRDGSTAQQPLDYHISGSCTNLQQDLGGTAYTSMAASNTARYRTASGDAVLKTNEITELIKKMCDSFTLSQEKLLAARTRPSTADMQVQCEDKLNGDNNSSGKRTAREKSVEREPVKLETSKSDTHIINNERDMVKVAMSVVERDAIMQKFVDELEDWKEKQQEMFKSQLKRKEEYHLELLANEWMKKRTELESKLSKGIEQCRNLAADLSRATEDFRLRGFRNTEREKKLLEAKKALEAHYTAKYQELREASQKMEADMNHQIKLKDMTVEEMAFRIQQLEKQVDLLKNNIKNNEKEAESRYSGLTKDQTASLIQELRFLEEKLDSAVQSKSFFKEQWGRAVRELHLVKLNTRRQMLTQLQHDRRELGDMGLDASEVQEQNPNQNPIDLKKLKDDFYVDLLANTPTLETPLIDIAMPGEMQMFDDLRNMPKNPQNEKINELIAQRDRLIQQDNPDENLLKNLNLEIRNMLLNCST